MQKVSLIEDDASMLSLLSTLLGLEGFQVAPLDGGTNLEETLENLRSEKPQLVLLDVHLPAMSSFDLLQRMRQDPELKSVQVLMSSGMELTDKCLQAGADDFILKPYMPDELIRKIRTLLEN